MMFIKFYAVSKVDDIYESKDNSKYFKYLALLFYVNTIVFRPTDNQNSDS